MLAQLAEASESEPTSVTVNGGHEWGWSPLHSLLQDRAGAQRRVTQVLQACPMPLGVGQRQLRPPAISHSQAQSAIGA